MTARRTAIVTGGVSGIGLGLVEHLLSTATWQVVIADIRPEGYASISASLDPERHIFVQTDVSSWESQAALFRRAFEWSGGRIDFFAANAGMVERSPLIPRPRPDDEVDAEPSKPVTLTTQVNQIGVIYGLRLFIHYSRRTAKALRTQPSPAPFYPKMVITASCTSLYPFPVAVEYAATKAAVLSLTRSASPALMADDNIALNCIMPAFVATGLSPKELATLWPQEWITPISTMVRAYTELIADDGRVEQDGKSDGEHGTVKVGQAVECVIDRLYYRRPVDYPDESQEYLIKEAFKPDGVWLRGLQASRTTRASADTLT